MSLITTYQGRKTLFAEKLNNKGINEAKNTDGLTTLIEYIDDISTGGGDGIILVGSNDSVQSGSTSHLSAISIEGNKLVNQPVTLVDGKVLCNRLTDNLDGFRICRQGDYDDEEIEVNISSEGFLQDTNRNIDCTLPLDLSEENIIISFKCKADENSSNALSTNIDVTCRAQEYDTGIFINDSWGCSFFDEDFSLPTGLDIHDWMDIKIECNPTEQKLYINDSLIITTYHEFRANSPSYYEGYNYYFIFKENMFWIKDFKLIKGTILATGNNGFISYTYTGADKGNKEFVAIQGYDTSTPFIIDDYLFVDTGISGDSNENNEYWSNYSTRTSVGATGTTVTGEIFLCKTVGGQERVWNEDIYIEFDVVSMDGGNPILQLYDGDTASNYQISETGHVLIKHRLNNPIIFKLNDNQMYPTTPANKTLEDTYRIGFQLGSSTSFVFKNWKMWYI